MGETPEWYLKRSCCITVDPRTERQYLLDQIKRKAEPGWQKVTSRVVPTGLKSYGLRVPVLREIARAWQRADQKVTREDLFAVVKAMWDGESREERMVALELLQHYPYSIPDLTWAHFERWRRDLDNWELTDLLGVRILGPWVLGDADARVKPLWDLIGEEDVWSRRLAMVSTVELNRGRKGISFPPLTLELIDQVKAERHPTITKAISWTLRELTKRHPDQVGTYLEGNCSLLAGHIVREVSDKLETGRKSG